MTVRRKGRSARRIANVAGEYGVQIQFRPGGFYWLCDNVLYTDVHHYRAAERIQTKLLPLALRAAERPGDWVK